MWPPRNVRMCDKKRNGAEGQNVTDINSIHTLFFSPQEPGRQRANHVADKRAAPCGPKWDRGNSRQPVMALLKAACPILQYYSSLENRFSFLCPHSLTLAWAALLILLTSSSSGHRIYTELWTRTYEQHTDTTVYVHMYIKYIELPRCSFPQQVSYWSQAKASAVRGKTCDGCEKSVKREQKRDDRRQAAPTIHFSHHIYMYMPCTLKSRYKGPRFNSMLK